MKDQKIRKLLDDIDEVLAAGLLKSRAHLVHPVIGSGKDPQGVDLKSLVGAASGACGMTQDPNVMHPSILRLRKSLPELRYQTDMQRSVACLQHLRVGLNTPALADLGDRWAGHSWLDVWRN